MARGVVFSEEALGIVKTKSQLVGDFLIVIRRRIFRTRRYAGRFLLNSRFVVVDIIWLQEAGQVPERKAKV